MDDTPTPNDGRRDGELAIRELADRLPDSLAPLARLAFNYRWTWMPGGAAVFRAMDPALWRRSACNPRWLIEAVPPLRLRALARDRAYVAEVRALAARLEADLARPPLPGRAPERPVAYFCSEFGIHCSLPLYGGGLGILAGDLLKAASDLALPMVGVGLLYRQGYFHQRLDLGGWQHEWWTSADFERLPVVLVTDRGRPLTVDVNIRGRTVRVQVWRVDVGRVPLFLLDADREDNDPVDRWITARLYVGDRQTRLAQYAVLGVGGVRALAALGIRPGLVHLNEGHAALGGIERLRVEMAGGRPAAEALAVVRGETLFTTHTPVAAGNEWYGRDEIEPALGVFADKLGSARPLFYELGRIDPARGDEPVSITPLALRTSRAANGVSQRHGEVARAMWQPLWPGRPVAEVPIGHVTNGVHTTTWMPGAMQELLDRHLGTEWREHLLDPAVWGRLAEIPDAELWAVRRTLRATLVAYARERSVHDRLARGESPEYVAAAARVFDPDVLTLGFARRVATYKRLHLLTRQLERGLRLLANERTPVQIVIAGKAHPQDEEARRSLRDVLAVRHAPNIGSRIVFLEDYDLHMAPRVIGGADVWVNLPRPPLEASGTSGMKAVLSGGLNLSVLDGWWPEGYDGTNGWAIATPAAEPNEQDDHDTSALFDLLEREVLPLFYDRGPDGIPHGWVARVKASLVGLAPRFSAERMLREYVGTMYADGAA
ncbi:MAG: alpha-glucan family phosphorylase [Candidatus Binatia bacterium]